MTLLENPQVATFSPLVNLSQKSETSNHPLGFTPAPSVTANASNKLTANEHEGKIKFALEEHPVDKVRPIKVGIIGAGLTGITAGVLLPAKLPGLDLRIYDKNRDVVCEICYL
jgi:hypothetical protein